jgi:alkylation response protein AidB-like acyl-CoA dehydrogenase
MIADMVTRYEAARLLLYETAWLFDQAYGTGEGSIEASSTAGERISVGTTTLARPATKRKRKMSHNGQPVDLTARAAAVKLLASTYAREVANLAVQIHGGAGYMEEYRVCRLYRDVKLAEIGGGTSEIQKQIIARSEEKRVR